jgi:hypothetical protein
LAFEATTEPIDIFDGRSPCDFGVQRVVEVVTKLVQENFWEQEQKQTL